MLLLLSVLSAWGAMGQSVKSCGTSKDHLQNVQITTTMDPIVKGKPFTITASGILDEDLGALNLGLDLDLTALGVINERIDGVMPVSISPSFPKGPFSLSIGPTMFPADIPGKLIIKGQVHILDDNSEQVLCLDLDIHIARGSAEDEYQIGSVDDVAPIGSESQVAVDPIVSCGKSSDHIQNFVLTENADNSATISGDLDETVSTVALNADLMLKVLFVKVPLGIALPLSFSPPIAEGPFSLSVGPWMKSSAEEVDLGGLSISITGTLLLDDQNDEQMACLKLDYSN